MDEQHQRVWAWCDGTLRVCDLDGQPIGSSTPTPAPGGGEAALVVHPDDGTLWLAVHKDLLHLDPQGSLLSASALGDQAVALALDADRGILWVATSKGVAAVDAINGAAVFAPDLGAKPDVADIAVDSKSGEVWVALKKELRRYSATGLLLFVGAFHQAGRVAISGDDGAWLAAKGVLRRIDAGGQILAEISPFGNSGTATALVTHPGEGSAWVSMPDAVAAVTSSGALAYSAYLSSFGEIRDLALFVDTTPPTLRITAPQPGAVVGTSRPAVELEYEDQGSGVDTGSLVFHLDGQPIQLDCTCGEHRASCAPAADVADGLVTLVASVADHEGNRCADVSVTFTVDTVPPEIVVSSPADGLLTNQPLVSLAGALSEPASLTIDGAPLAVADDLTFTGQLPLQEGANAVAFRAEDRAGHVTDVLVTVLLDTVPPAAIDAARVEVGMPVEGTVAVTGGAGAAEAGAAVRLTNPRTGEIVDAIAAADGAFTATITAAGGDQLFLVAIDPAGNVGPTIGVTVLSDPTLPPDPASVAPPLDLTVPTNLFDATEFIYSGPDSIQTGVEPGTVEPRRAAVLRGLVKDRAGQPLPGVTVAVKDHPEIGQTLSRADGVFDLVVNGGGLLTVSYDKTGYLGMHRQIEVPWGEWSWLPEVVMIQPDAQASLIDLSQPAMQVARGSVVTDEDGVRQGTLLVPAGTTASLLMPDGSTQPVPQLSVRITEYTVGTNGPQAMPAELPANVAYTYCVELSSDEADAVGATGVSFNHPVIFYVENFLGFPVGMQVPMGFYDPEKAAWVPSASGKIVKILGVTAGLADLDIDGDGEADPTDELALLGIGDAERAELVARNQVAATLWRVPIPHLSKWDANWPFDPPEDADWPPDLEPEHEGGAPLDDGPVACGSRIDVANRAVEEAVAIAGAPVTLHYHSINAAGRQDMSTLTIKVSASSVPASLKRVEVTVEIAGKKTTTSLSPTPEQTFSYHWDGKDACGRPMQGAVGVTVAVGFVYDGVYSTPSGRFGYDGGGRISGSKTRGEVTFWRSTSAILQPPAHLRRWDATKTGFAGWSLGIHHTYDALAKLVHLGSGGWRKATDVRSVLTAEVPEIGDGGLAVAANLSTPGGLTVGADRSLYFSDLGHRRIRRVQDDRTIVTAAGRGSPDWEIPDGASATNAGLDTSYDIAAAPDGGFLIAETLRHRIRRVWPDGTITTVAGSGIWGGFGGDGGPATQATLNYPFGVAVSNDGSVYIADYYNHRVRRITPEGMMTTFAGKGLAGHCGDGGAATEACLYRPSDVVVAADGTVYIADMYNNRVRRVLTDGTIITVAGTGPAGFSGDGGPAVQARLNRPYAVALGHDGSLVIADYANHRVRRVGTDGTIDTVAGNGVGAISPDGGSATASSLYYPMGVAATADGSVFISDGYGNRVRVVTPDGVLNTVAGYAIQGVGNVRAASDPDRQRIFLLLDREEEVGDAELAVANTESAVPAEKASAPLRSEARTAALGLPVPGLAHDDILIPSGDGTELYLFDRRGRHLKTLDTVTGKAVHSFAYDLTGRVVAVTDIDGRTTLIDHDGAGNPTAVVTPEGLRTTLTVGADGLLDAVFLPDGTATRFTYGEGGLLTTVRDPRGNEKHYAYDEAGRLESELDAAGGSQSFTRVDSESAGTKRATVTRTTAEGRVTTWVIDRLPNGDARQTTSEGGCNCEPSEVLRERDGDVIARASDGTVTATREGPDPRFGQQVSLPSSVTVSTPSGLAASATMSRTFTRNPARPLGHGLLTDRLTINGRTWTTVVNGNTRTVTSTSPAGRTVTSSFDANGRITSHAVPGIEPVTYGYDLLGRMTSVTQGARTAALGYSPEGWLAGVTDPLGRSVTFEHDAVGRVVRQTLPGGRQIGFTYVANGNVRRVGGRHVAGRRARDRRSGGWVEAV